MAIRYKAWMLALACCALTAPAMAREEGPYVAFAGGISNPLNACKSPNVAGASCTEKGSAPTYLFTYGYRFDPSVALEIGYGKLGSASATNGWALDANGLALASVFTLHMGDAFAVFGKVGVVRSSLTESNGSLGITYANSTLSSFTYAGGVQFDFTPKLAVRLQFDNWGTYNLYAGQPKVRILANSLVFMVKY
jgi:opacity protein-like surface antigen